MGWWAIFLIVTTAYIVRGVYDSKKENRRQQKVADDILVLDEDKDFKTTMQVFAEKNTVEFYYHFPDGDRKVEIYNYRFVQNELIFQLWHKEYSSYSGKCLFVDRGLLMEDNLKKEYSHYSAEIILKKISEQREELAWGPCNNIKIAAFILSREKIPA